MNAAKTLDERYFDWLCEQVGVASDRDPAKSHTLLAEQLYLRQFDDSMPNDFNRASDGKALRDKFLSVDRTAADAEWLAVDCSMLEMFIALAERVAFHIDWSCAQAFWLLMTNVELEKYTDDRYHDGISAAVDHVINTINNRTYDYDGQGGVFPLTDPQNDQRGVEIWYQMSAYLLENFQF